MKTFLAIFLHYLRRLRGATIGWVIGLVAYSALSLTSWSIINSLDDEMLKLVDKYPPEMAAFLGDMTRIMEPPGFLHIYLFSMLPVILGIFLVTASTALVVRDEEAGRMDLFLSYPVSRKAMFFGRLTALFAVTVLILFSSYIVLALGAPSVDLALDPLPLLRPYADTLALSALFIGFGLLMSLFLPSRKHALMASAALLVASYVIPPLGKINPDLVPLARLVPGYYYQGGEALAGLDLAPVLTFVGLAAVLILTAHFLFQRRDIRVSGEGNLSWLPRRRKESR